MSEGLRFAFPGAWFFVESQALFALHSLPTENSQLNTQTKTVPRVVFVTSHPIQYQVPVFRHLAKRDDLDFHVLFAMLPDAATQGDGFGVNFQWDLPLLEGYSYQVLQNVAKRPAVTRFSGCDTPGIDQALRAYAADVVVVNGWVVKTCLQGLWACKRLRIPCVVRGEANHLRPRAWWKRLLQRQLIRQYDACLPIGKVNRDFYLSMGVSQDRLFDCLYCVENERFAESARAMLPERESFRKRWDIPPDRLCLLYCGKFETKKHPIELIQCLAQAIARGADLHLLMVGTGELLAECRNLAEVQQLPVTFAGFLNQSEIAAAYVAADILALPSDFGETWGLVVNEAMACGLPGLVSDQVGCAADLIVEGRTGWVFRFGEWNQLTDLLLKLSSKTERVRQMSEACRQTVSKYSPGAAAEGVAVAIQALLEGRVV